jgi:peptidoglycan/LPS O-acetylase OafA/YrhL
MLIMWAWYYAEAHPEARMTILIIVIVIIAIILVAGVIVYYLITKRRQERLAEGPPRVQGLRARRREMSTAKPHAIKYCIQCGKQIEADAQFCEFCAAKQNS